MPTSNPVYQPTTVTYERHKEWSSNYITERVIPNCYQKPYLQRLLLVGAIMLAMIGLGLAIYALVNDVNTHKDEPEGPPVFEDNSEEDFEKEETSDSNEPGSHDHATNVVLGSVGITLILVSLVMYVMFLKLRGMCRGLLPHHHSPRSAGNMHSSGGQPIHSESDHPTVVSYKGVQQEPGALNLEPAAPMEEERHSLMDSKFQSPDTPPPVPKRRRSLPNRFRRGRIGAPLASQETLGPSIHSSFCSDIIFLDDQTSCHNDLDESEYSQEPSLYQSPSREISPAGHSV